MLQVHGEDGEHRWQSRSQEAWLEWCWKLACTSSAVFYSFTVMGEKGSSLFFPGWKEQKWCRKKSDWRPKKASRTCGCYVFPPKLEGSLAPRLVRTLKCSLPLMFSLTLFHYALLSEAYPSFSRLWIQVQDKASRSQRRTLRRWEPVSHGKRCFTSLLVALVFYKHCRCGAFQ